MFWNWNTIDACFVTSAWQITSPGMFTAFCTGVLCLAASFEALGRMSQKYDKHIFRQFQYAPIPSSDDGENHSNDEDPSNVAGDSATEDKVLLNGKPLRRFPSPVSYLNTKGHFRPNMAQQGIRAGIYMVRFGVAYFIMLLAMNLNGYLILAILMGTYMGSFVFSW
ncbi:Copper Transporter integral membrane protein that functions in high affinity copper transport [Lobaria immixta]|nr:Copper Transporter integral membrane protein that functions in high affinity copper transport [Lobaria immixta]